MKIIITFVLLVFAFNVSAQKTYNNDIKNLKELKIYGNNAKVVVGKIIVNQSLSTKLLLTGFSQAKDNSDNYVTTLVFTSNSNINLSNVNVYLRFDAPTISITPVFGAPGGMNLSNSTNADRTEYSFSAGQLNANFFTIYVTSKTKLFTTISGVDGMDVK